MSLALAMEVEGERQIATRLGSIPADFNRLKDPFRRTGWFIWGEVRRNYDSQGAHFGRRWAPVKRATPPPPLVKTGRMRARWNIDADDTGLEFSNQQDYFKYHQSNRPRRKLPRRVMLELTHDMRRKAIREVVIEAEEIIKKRQIGGR